MGGFFVVFFYFLFFKLVGFTLPLFILSFVCLFQILTISDNTQS